MIPRESLAVPAALIGAAVAAHWQGTPVGAMAWSMTVAVAWLGYGHAVARVAGDQLSLGLRIVTGFAALLIVSTIAAKLGMLTRGVQLGAIVAGIILAALPGASARPSTAAPWVWVVTAIAAVLLFASATLALDGPCIADGLNHGFAIKQLWDTGGLLGVHHQSGLQLVGESYGSLVGGAQACTVFEPGTCATLLVIVLASELATREDPFAIALFVVAALAIVVVPPIGVDSAWWSAVLLVVGGVLALRAAPEGRIAWSAFVLAVALAMLRNEFVMLAIPLGAAAITRRARTLTPRWAAAIAVGWVAALIGLQLSLAVPAHAALVNAVRLVLVIPPTLAVAHLLGRFGWRTAVGALLVGVATTLVAVACKAIGTAHHEPASTLAILFAAGLAILASVDQTVLRDTGLRAGAIAFLLVGFVDLTILQLQFFGPYREHLSDRLIAHVVELRYLHVVGSDHDAQRDVRLLQDQVPAHQRVGFWGQNAAELDFRRDRIRDLSWPPGSHARHLDEYLTPLEPASVRGLDYVIVEDIASTRGQDGWGAANVTPVSGIAAFVDPVATRGRARLYRVRQAR